jgi:prephenate dehydrogenase
MKKEVAIIGYGRFGSLAARYLKRYFRVYVADVKKLARDERGIHIVPIHIAATKDIIILAVPINRMVSVLHTIVPYLKDGALICDVCSVKEYPARWMKDILPKSVLILATHPLFGPGSASKQIVGKTIVLTPGRIPKTQLSKIRHHLTKVGLHTITMSASRHDRLMAETLFLTQFIGHGLLRLPLPRTPITTQNFELLSQIVSTAANDSTELFNDMFRYNRFALKIPKHIVRRFLTLSRSLTSSQR